MWQPVQPAWWLPYVAACVLCSLSIWSMIDDYPHIRRLVDLDRNQFIVSYFIATMIFMGFFWMLSFRCPVAAITLGFELLRQRVFNNNN